MLLFYAIINWKKRAFLEWCKFVSEMLFVLLSQNQRWTFNKHSRAHAHMPSRLYYLTRLIRKTSLFVYLRTAFCFHFTPSPSLLPENTIPWQPFAGTHTHTFMSVISDKITFVCTEWYQVMATLWLMLFLFYQTNAIELLCHKVHFI